MSGEQLSLEDLMLANKAQEELDSIDTLMKRDPSEWSQAQHLAVVTHSYWAFNALRTFYKERFGVEIILPEDGRTPEKKEESGYVTGQ
jgi:hypothetical protein